MNSRYIFIPIEVKARELAAKTLMAAQLADFGFDVVIGCLPEMIGYVGKMPRGVFIDNSITTVNKQQIDYLRKLGNAVVAWCEEGLVILDEEFYVKRRVSEEVLAAIDMFFAWGENQANAIARRFPEHAHKIRLTGNPRLDLLVEPYTRALNGKSDEIRQEFGDFVLINTSFGIYNNYFGTDFYLDKMIWNRGSVDVAHEKYCRDYYAHTRDNFFYFSKLVKSVSERYPRQQFVLRPHPSENHQYWHDLVKGCPNVRVVARGGPVEWLKACKLLIQTSCMTGLEGYLAGARVINYSPNPSPIYEPEIIRKVGIEVGSLDELHAIMDKFLEEDNVSFSKEGDESFLGSYIANYRKSPASRLIANELINVILPADVSRFDRFLALMNWKIKNWNIAAKQALKNIFTRLDNSAEQYWQQKCSGIALDEIEMLLQGFVKAGNLTSGITCARVGASQTLYRVFTPTQ